MTSSNQAISPKVLPAELSYALANIDRLESALISLVNLTAQANPLLGQHLQQLQQEMQQSRHAVEAAYMDARMSGFGTHSLIQHQGRAVRVGAARSAQPVDMKEMTQFLMSRLFDIDPQGGFKIHSGLSVLDTVDNLNTLIRDEKLPTIRAGIYTNGDDQDIIVPLRYVQNGLEVLTMVAWHPQQPNRISINHHLLVASEGGWLADVDLRYFNAEQFKMGFMMELAAEIQGQSLCAKAYKDQVDEVLKLADEVLSVAVDKNAAVEAIEALNDGGIRLKTGARSLNNGSDEVVNLADAVIVSFGPTTIADENGQIEFMPWTWRVAQLSTLRMQLHSLLHDFGSRASDQDVEAEEEQEEE